MAGLRISELTRILEHRYGPQLPDDDAGREDMGIMLHHLAHTREPEQAIMGWIAVRCPWMPIAKATSLMRQTVARPQKWNADDLAERLRLTEAERDALHVTTIGAIDLPKHARLARRKKRKRQAEKAKRQAKGSRTRAEYEAQALTRTKPWEAEGISRRTWERRRKSA